MLHNGTPVRACRHCHAYKPLGTQGCPAVTGPWSNRAHDTTSPQTAIRKLSMTRQHLSTESTPSQSAVCDEGDGTQADHCSVSIRGAGPAGRITVL
jgi:hypothetical protein